MPHAAFVINKFLVGKDGRTPHYRIYNRNFGAKTYEIGEQVMVKPKRRRKDNKKRSLAARCVEATWTGFETRSNEHFVILKDGGPAIKVRTVKPRAEGDRWSADAIFKIMATPDAPNPWTEDQTEARAERHTKGLDFGVRGGQDLPEVHAEREPELVRQFRISDDLLEKHGFTPGCKGCESRMEGGGRRGHTTACRARIEASIIDKNPDADVLKKRDQRFKKKADERHSHESAKSASGDATGDPKGRNTGTVSEEDSHRIPEPPPRGGTDEKNRADKEEDEVDNDENEPDTKKQRLEAVKSQAATPQTYISRASNENVQSSTRRERITCMLKETLKEMVYREVPMVAALCTKEAMEAKMLSLEPLIGASFA